MQQLLDDSFKDMKLQIQGLVPPGQQLHRNVLFDQLYASIPKDLEAKVQICTGLVNDPSDAALDAKPLASDDGDAHGDDLLGDAIAQMEGVRRR
jgi:hypothetical protein